MAVLVGAGRTGVGWTAVLQVSKESLNTRVNSLGSNTVLCIELTAVLGILGEYSIPNALLLSSTMKYCFSCVSLHPDRTGPQL